MQSVEFEIQYASLAEPHPEERPLDRVSKGAVRRLARSCKRSHSPAIRASFLALVQPLTRRSIAIASVMFANS